MTSPKLLNLLTNLKPGFLEDSMLLNQSANQRMNANSLSRMRARRRRGVTLLFVISFIVLFLLMGTAFVVVSTQFLSTSRQRTRLEADETDRTTLIHKVLYDILRGPDLDNRLTSLRGHALLADQYGYGAKARISRAAIDPSGQFVVLQVESLSTPALAGGVTDLLSNRSMALSEATGAYDGLVLTFIDGPAGALGRVKGVSTRIVRYEYVPFSLSKNIYISAKWSNSSINPFDPARLPTDVVGSTILINGREFNGTGAGQFNQNAGKVEPALSTDALQPNQSGKLRGDELTPGTLVHDYLRGSDGSGTPASMFWRPAAGVSPYANLGIVGGSPNESYDIADYQNMFLSQAPLDPAQPYIPSFHRPRLANYHLTNMVPLGVPMSRVMFRPYFSAADPTHTANDQFPSNDLDGDGLPDFWDIDNDNDGVRDSVWIDVGLPVQYSRGGRRYRPLAAIMIKDLDGRLNLNAHGNIVDSERTTAANPYELTFQPLLYNPPPSPATLNQSLPRGQYLGPPEISLDPILGAADYQTLLSLRYGVDGLPGIVAVDPFAAYDLFDYPSGAVLANNIGASYSTPLDIHGRFGYAYPSTGFPAVMPSSDALTSTLTARLGGEATNSPYEMNFATRPFNSIADNPFNPSEMEYFLRPFDRDAEVLRNRLSESPTLGPALFNARNFITTESWEVPTAPGHLAQFLYEQMIANGVTPTNATTELNEMFAIDIARGLRFNLNRPFGDGADDNANLVVDDPLELATDQAVAHPNASAVLLQNPGTTTNDARIAFARQLYVLAYMVARPTNRDLNRDGMVDVNDKHFLAQWVANIVDYRDADSINFGFEYDLNPYDGWGVDGDLATDEGAGVRGFVWGAERPELLLTEAVGLHDRRTEDRDDDASGEFSTAGGGSDRHYDNRLRPAPSGFIEIYNPWTSSDNTLNQRMAPELYEYAGAVPVGVDLDRTTPGTADPVWRMIVVRDATVGAIDTDPDNQDPTANGGVALDTNPLLLDVERSIYFARPTQAYAQSNGAGGTYGDGKQFFSSLTVNSLNTGQYAVIGGFNYQPGGGGYRTNIGRLTTAIEGDEASLLLANTRGINLIPGAANGVVMTIWNGAAIANFARNAVGIVIDQAIDAGTPVTRPFSFSGPVDGYPALDVNGVAATPVGDGVQYAEPFDIPLDYDSGLHPLQTDRDAINQNGTTPKFRTVHLQRLANPLLPWNALTNPYITQDRINVDLVAYNGVISAADSASEESLTDGTTTTQGGITNFKNMERGESETGVANQRRRLWPQDPPFSNPANDDPQLLDNHFYNFRWKESLGQINVAYTAPYDMPTVFTASANDGIHGFPWLSWANRPYTSQLELANVPVHRNSQILNPNNFSLSNTNIAVYNDQAAFGHLPSLFGISHGGTSTSGGDPYNSPAALGSDLHKLLEYLEVPSRFIGTDEYFTPAVAQSILPPYDRISRYRYPGKLNLNTIALNGLTSPAWSALMNPYSAATLPNINSNPIASRSSTGGVPLASLPTEYPSPFRMANSANHVPPIVGTGLNGNELVRWDVDTGVFRSTTPGLTTALPTTQPAFDPVGPTTANPYNDWSRSAYFRNDARQRLGNTTTTRSSVYAVWITIGYFEVDNEGRVGAELGWDTGSIKRHRGFFLIDRSIPVGVEPGFNHNVNRCILIQSIID